MILKYKKARKDIKVPERANPSDAGLDLFFNALDDRHVMIEPHHSVLLPTGIMLEVPHGYVAEVKARSGMAAKRGLVPLACVVDSGYAGEIFVNLHNDSDHTQAIYPGDKVAQLVIYPVLQVRLQESDEIYVDDVCMSNRGDGALGSTDKKQ